MKKANEEVVLHKLICLIPQWTRNTV